MSKRKTAFAILGAAASFTLAFLVYKVSVSFGPGQVIVDERVLYRVTRVVDGDTFKAMIGRQEITVRMLGINAPETVDPRKPTECFGPEASTEAKSLLAGRSVRLIANRNREAKDRYGRYLLYVYRDDGLAVNESLLQEGFAREYTVGRPYALQKRFRDTESGAKKALRGLWKACPGSL